MEIHGTNRSVLLAIEMKIQNKINSDMCLIVFHLVSFPFVVCFGTNIPR